MILQLALRVYESSNSESMQIMQNGSTLCSFVDQKDVLDKSEKKNGAVYVNG